MKARCCSTISTLPTLRQAPPERPVSPIFPRTDTPGTAPLLPPWQKTPWWVPKADTSAIQTQRIETGILPRLFTGYTLHWGFVIAIVTVITILFILKKTTFGYRARMGGLNPRFAEYGGINSQRMMYGVLLLSGALAGSD